MKFFNVVVAFLNFSFIGNNCWAQADLNLNLPVVKYKLENGLTVILLEDHSTPQISYHTWYKVGSRDESEGVTGAAHMLEHMMFKGARKYSGAQYDQLMHENGIQHNAFTTFDYTGFYQSLPSSKLELIMDIEVDRMESLSLNPDDLTSEREVVKEERRWRVDNNPGGVLAELTMGTVFKNHPYRWPVIGYMKDITNYSVDKLRYFYSTYYIPNNAILVIVGDFRINETKNLIDKYYGKLPFKELPVKIIKPEPPQTVQYNAKTTSNVKNTSFNVSFQGFPQGHKDMYALDLAAFILGTGSSSRLYKKLVNEKGFATQAVAGHFSMQDHGLFSVSVHLKPGTGMDEALNIVYNEIYKLRNNPVSNEELEKAKTLSMKSTVDSLVSMDGKARALATYEILTGSYENLLTDLTKYAAVTVKDIQDICARMLNTTQRSIVVLEPKNNGGN